MIAAPAMCCLKCGYDFGALPHIRRPECGGAFDPNNARTFQTGRQRTAAQEARLIALAASAFPLLTVFLLHLAWIAARLELGR